MTKRIRTSDAVGVSNQGFENRRKNAAILSKGYTGLKRIQEYICFFAFTIAESHLCYRAVKLANHDNYVYIIILAVFGIIAADFVGGVVHWMADTWGTLETPIVRVRFVFFVSFF